MRALTRLERSPPWRLLRFAVAELRYRSAIARHRADPKARSGKPVLLVINHYFDNELRVLREHAGFAERFEIVALSPWDLFNKNLWYFPPDVWYARRPYVGAEYEANRRRSRVHARRALDDLLAIYDVAALITPNDWFYWMREFWHEGQARGLPTFLFDKEGMTSPVDFAYTSLKIKDHFPPISDHIFVWSERQKKYWLRAGAETASIQVLGSLRTDQFVRLQPPSRKAVLYYDFELENYLFAIPPEERQRFPGNWEPFRDELDDVLLAKIRQYPEVAFTVKCHPQQPDVRARIAKYEGSGLANVRVRHGSVGVNEIVAQHSLVIGFQTTALFEVGLTDRPTVYVGWGPLHEHFRHHLIPLMEPGFGTIHAQDATTLGRWIDAHLAGTGDLPKASCDRIETYFHQPDGHVADRYFDAVTAALGRAKTRSSAAATARPSSSV